MAAARWKGESEAGLGIHLLSGTVLICVGQRWESGGRGNWRFRLPATSTPRSPTVIKGDVLKLSKNKSELLFKLVFL